jgi:hypothetical protein
MSQCRLLKIMLKSKMLNVKYYVIIRVYSVYIVVVLRIMSLFSLVFLVVVKIGLHLGVRVIILNIIPSSRFYIQ